MTKFYAVKPYTTTLPASSVTIGTALWQNEGISLVRSFRQEWVKSQYVGCWINGVWFDPCTFVDVVVGASTK